MKRGVSIICSLAMVLQLLLTAVPVWAEEGDETAKYQAPDSPAVTYNMNVDWKFKKAEEEVYDKDNNPSFSLATATNTVLDANGKKFYEADYDDSTWETVSVPHPINAEDSFDGTGVTDGEGGLYRGFMFYRKHITIPQSDAGKKLILEFEAVRQTVYLYVNGELVGFYEAGIAPMGFDITKYVTPGEDTVIAVATDNMGARGINNDFAWAYGSRETIPGETPGGQSGVTYQWNTKEFNEIQGGITGNVNLYAKNKIYQTLPLYNNLKTTGNYIYGSNFDFREGSADITVEAEVRNETDLEKDITLQVDVVDGDGKLVDTFTETAAVAAATDKDAQFLSMVPENAYNENKEGQENNNVDISTVDVSKITATKNISGLKFWSDVSPNLYTVYTYLKDGETVIDSQSKITGFREVVYDKDKGLQINGEATYLKGYAQRSTNEWAAIGVANDWLEDMDMQWIKESNANYIRWMHVAPKPNEIRSGDKYGVISIAPAGDKEKDTAGRSWDQRVEAMRDTIIYFRNSPSVLFWEAGNNEITAAHMKEMTDLRKALDPSGDRRMGCRTISSEAQIAEAEWAGTMLNRHDASAYSSMQKTGNYIPILETEYHRNESPRRVWDDYSPPDYDYVNKWSGNRDAVNGLDMWDQTQEDFSRTMFAGDGYAYFYNNRVGGSGNPYYAGAAMMVWSDSNMHVRNCYSENARASGRVDPVRLKKESFYAIQAAQSSTPKIHILGHWNYPKYIKGDEENGNYWYNEKKDNGAYYVETGEKLQRDPTKKTVYVVGSNGLSKVELYVNGELKGTDTTPTDNYVYAFDGIDVTQSGKVSAKAYNDRDEVVAEHEIKTVGEPATVRLTPVKGPDGLIADGSDIAYVDVEVVDAEGNVCPTDERKITFTISGPGVFMGGYNSGVGSRIVNHKDYVFAECGINRVFIRSTREAGEITLTAQGEGFRPVEVKIDSVDDLAIENGLTEKAQRSFKQGEVPEPPKPQSAPALKSLGEAFTADWTETTGNVEKVQEAGKEYYTVTVNGTEVTFTDKAYKESGDLIFGEINPVLAALKTAGANFDWEYVTEGDIPSVMSGVAELPYIKMTVGDDTIYVANKATDMFINGVGTTMMAQPVLNSAQTAIMADFSPIINKIPNVSLSRNEEKKKVEITTTASAELSSADTMSLLSDNTYPASLSNKKGAVTVTATEKITNAKLIIAGYDENNALQKVKTANITLEAGKASAPQDFSADMEGVDKVRAMLWNSLDKMQPIAEPIDCPDTVGYKVDAVYEYDTVQALNECNEAIADTVLSDDNAPDGTKYITVADGKEIKAASLDDDSSADIMWSVDVRFNKDGSSIIPRNKSKNYGTCVLRHDQNGTPKLAIQTGSKDFTHYETIDPSAWYHLVLIGRYSAPDARTDLILYKYENGKKVLVARHDNVNQRNLSANSKSGAQYWYANTGISIDNAQITMLGADTLDVTSKDNAEELKAGNNLQMSYSATRQGAYITKPAVTWEIYDEADENVLNSEETGISIDANGILNVSLDAADRVINVRATAQIKEGKAIHTSKKITVKSVDISDVKFDTLTLSAEKDYVSAAEPLTITAAATKNGAAVTLADSDLIWYAADKTNMMKLGDDLKWIKIENGVVTVDPKAISQDITIRAADPDDKVRGSIAVHIKSSDALEGNEEGTSDRLLTADNCEAPIETAELVESIDGTHAYKAAAGYQTAFISETGSDIVVEMDIRFDGEGAGFQPAKNGKLNTCVVSHDGKFSIQTGQSNYTSYVNISPATWYHIRLIRKQGAYAHIILEKYDENGERTPVGIYEDVNQRNNEATAFVNINAGTTYDNLRILTPAPTNITIDTDAKTVFAGDTIQASSALFWNNLEMKNPDASTFEYKIYDGENKYPLPEDAKITVDAAGLIKIDAMADIGEYYVRAIAKASGKFASEKFRVNSSDIIEIKKLGVNEDETRLVNLTVDKKFYYATEMTFLVKVSSSNGNVKAVYTKSMYGDALAMGENTVALGFDLPADFNKAADEIRIYAFTKTNSDDATEADANIKVQAGDTSSHSTVRITDIPTFDAGSTILVMALKADADETNVQAEDILYFDQIKTGDITDNTLIITSDYQPGMTVKLSGNKNGVHTVLKGMAQQ